jgi:hypothetical protein
MCATEGDLRRWGAPLTKRAPLAETLIRAPLERPGRGDLREPQPSQAERAVFQQYWPFPASSCRRVLNGRTESSKSDPFGSPDRTRTCNLLVDSAINSPQATVGPSTSRKAGPRNLRKRHGRRRLRAHRRDDHHLRQMEDAERPASAECLHPVEEAFRSRNVAREERNEWNNRK